MKRQIRIDDDALDALVAFGGLVEAARRYEDRERGRGAAFSATLFDEESGGGHEAGGVRVRLEPRGASERGEELSGLDGLFGLELRE